MTPSTIHDPEEITRRAEELSNEMGIPVTQGVEAFTTQSGTCGLADRAEWTSSVRTEAGFL